MSELADKILTEAKDRLGAAYDEIPETAKNQLPRAAELVAAHALTGGESANLKQALSLLKDVQVGGRIALNELLVEAAEDVLSRAATIVRRLLGA